MTAHRPDPEADLDALFAELRRAERRSARIPEWAGVAGRLGRPGLLDRAPMGLAAGLRGAGALLQPSAAGAIAVTLAGLALGAWLALAVERGAVASLAAAPYESSSLLGDEADGLSASYLSPGETAGAGSSAGNGALPDAAGERSEPIPADLGVPDSGGAGR